MTLNGQTVANLHGVLRAGLEAKQAPPAVVEAADELFFELAARAGFPFLGWRSAVEAIDGRTMEVVGPDGEVHYRRPEGDPLLTEARARPGYSVRPGNKGGGA